MPKDPPGNRFLTILFERVLYAWRRLYVIRGAMFVFVRLVSRGSERGAKRRIVRAIASFWSIANTQGCGNTCARRGA